MFEQQNTLITKIQQSIAEVKSSLGSEINSLKFNLDFIEKNINELIDYSKRQEIVNSKSLTVVNS